MTGSGEETGARLAAEGDPKVACVVQKREFVDRVLAKTGARRAEARPIIEATLAELGRVLEAGQTLAVPPLGRARVSSGRDARGVQVITLRLRRPATDRASAAPEPVLAVPPAGPDRALPAAQNASI